MTYASLLKNFKFRFQLYYILKSTAWITPIFFLFLEKKAGLSISEILKVSGSLMILPILFDAPLGMLADRFGARKLLVSGTLFQLLSMMAFFWLPAPYNYLSYLVSIIIADNCYSGAEQSFLRQNLKDDREIRDFLKATNQYFYYITIPAIIGGVILYHFNPYLPLVVQSISFFLAFLAIVSFQADHELEVHEKESSSAIVENIRLVFTSRKVLGFILMGIIFSGLIQINSKTIQGQIGDVGLDHFSFWLGLSYVVGNLASGSALQFWRRTPLNDLKAPYQFMVLFGLIFLTQISTAVKSVAIICLGFIALSGIKSIFRPLLSGELIAYFRNHSGFATKLSIVSTSTTIGIAGLHVLNSKLLETFGLGNFPLAIALVFVFFGALYLIWEPRWVRLDSVSSVSGKMNFVGTLGKQDCIKQIYPEWAELPNVDFIRSSNAGLKIPLVVSQNINEICWQWIDGKTLSNLGGSQYEIAKAVLGSLWKDQVNSEDHEYLNGRDFLLFLEDSKLVEFLDEKKHIRYTHGDLNPSNIVVKSSEPYLIDWDMFGKGYFWFDILSLVVHPLMKLTKDERQNLIQEQLPDLSSSSIEELVRRFVQYKTITLSQIVGAEHLAEGYRTL